MSDFALDNVGASSTASSVLGSSQNAAQSLVDVGNISATDKVSLFKVVTAKDEIVIGLTEEELARFEGKNAGGIAKALKSEGTLSVWRYAMRKAGTALTR